MTTMKPLSREFANNIIRVLDTAQLLKDGCQAHGLALTDAELLNAAIELIKLHQGRQPELVLVPGSDKPSAEWLQAEIDRLKGGQANG